MNIRTYSKSELATYYMPHLAPESARKNLRIWIKSNKEMEKELVNLGYKPNNVLLTPAQVAVIVKYIGVCEEVE